jgi:hypothetical protein
VTAEVDAESERVQRIAVLLRSTRGMSESTFSDGFSAKHNPQPRCSIHHAMDVRSSVECPWETRMRLAGEDDAGRLLLLLIDRA